MTSRERLLTALNGGTPDKMPVTLFIQSQGHFVTQLEPDADPWDFEYLQKKECGFSAFHGRGCPCADAVFQPS